MAEPKPAVDNIKEKILTWKPEQKKEVFSHLIEDADIAAIIAEKYTAKEAPKKEEKKGFLDNFFG